MNSVHSLSYPLQPFTLYHSMLQLDLQPRQNCSFHVVNRTLSSLPRVFPRTSSHATLNRKAFVNALTPSSEGAISVINFEDFTEKDWSFLDVEDSTFDLNKEKADRIISAGKIEASSRVLVSISSEGFVDRLVNSSPCQQLLVVHDSLFLLACVKERYDMVKCWQGELVFVPEKWGPFDAVFLYFLPALSRDLGELFGALSKRCLPGARIVISHLQGRKVLEQQRQQFPDVIVSGLPDETTLQSVAAAHSFEIVEFLDHPGFYLSVLRFKSKDLTS